MTTAAALAPGPLQLDPLEVASGVLFGPRRGAPTESREAEGPARQVLERLLLEALSRPPCIVAFSGGRDSSAILAEATRVAREHGLPEPIPHTLRFPGAPRTAETDWQELVVSHLGLAEWSRRQVGEDLDALGPAALKVLRRFGVHWPPNAHTVELLLEPAAGGSLLTGNGGDELFIGTAAERLAWLRQPRGARRAYLKAIATPYLPLAVLARRPRFRLDWLTPEAAAIVARKFALTYKERHDTWGEMLEDRIRSRYTELAVGVSEAMAADADVRLVEPFFDAGYMRAVAAGAPADGYPSRTVAMERNFGDLLPPRLAGRTGKATFTEVFAGAEVRRFAAAWDGSGLDPALVDAEALRRHWLAERTDLRTLVPLQAAWLAQA